MNGADRATVSFRQNYKSDVLKSNSRKTLVLVKADGALEDPSRRRAADAMLGACCPALCCFLRLHARAAAPTPEDKLSRVFEAIEANRLDDAMQRVDALIPRISELPPGAPGARRPAARPRAPAADLRQCREDRPEREGRRPARRGACAASRDAPASRRRSPAALRAAAARRAEARAGGRFAPLAPVRLRATRRARRGWSPTTTSPSARTASKRRARATRRRPWACITSPRNLPRKKLTDFYGAGAFPINYPNEWDRRQGRGGFGIWLHGVPSDVYSRPPRASDGCIVLSNPDLESVGRHVQVGLTPVIIADEIEWSDAATIAAERAALSGAVEQWRADWQSRDTERYLAHYSSRFASGRPESRRLGDAQAQGERRQALDQGRPVARRDVPLPARARLRGRDLRPGLPLERPVERDAQAPVLGQGRRGLENHLRGGG